MSAPKPLTSSLPLPGSPETFLHISVTILATSYLIFLTSNTSASAAQIQPAVSSLADLSLADTSQVQGLPAPASAPAPVSNAALGSFIYGLPNRFSPAEPLTTALISVPASLDLATRLCKILVRKLAGIEGAAKPIYLGCSITLDGFGDRVEEEMTAVRTVVAEVVRLVQDERPKVNGVKV